VGCVIIRSLFSGQVYKTRKYKNITKCSLKGMVSISI
jgi:hypothetical protein